MLKVLLVLKVLLAHKVLKVLLVHKDQRAHKVLRGLLVLLALKVLRVEQVPRVQKAKLGVHTYNLVLILTRHTLARAGLANRPY